MIELIPQLEPAASVVERWLRPVIWISPDVPGVGEPGRSRIGGSPDLPPSVPWPARPTPGGSEGHFDYLLQINLAELPDAGTPPLPDRGMLWLFEVWNSPDDHNQLTVYTGDEELEPTPHPPGDYNYADEVIPHMLEFRAGLDLPRWSSDADDQFRRELAEALELPGGEFDEQLDFWLIEQRDHMAGDAIAWLFGYTSGIGGSVHEYAETHRIEPTAMYDWARRKQLDLTGSSRWRNLLTVETNDAVCLMIGDAGYTVALIRDDDLAANDFTRVFLSNESS